MEHSVFESNVSYKENAQALGLTHATRRSQLRLERNSLGRNIRVTNQQLVMGLAQF